MKKREKDNGGAVSVLVILSLLFLVSVFFAVFMFAQLVSAVGMAADAASLADNSVKASYNKAIWDAYGIFCYTQSEGDLSKMATDYMDRSIVFDAEPSAEVKFMEKTLADEGQFTAQVDSYMKKWDAVASNVSVTDLYSFKNVMKNSAKIRKKLEDDLKSSSDGYLGSQVVVSVGSKEESTQEKVDASKHLEQLLQMEEADDARKNTVGTTTPDKLTLYVLSPATFSYTGASGLIKPQKMRVDNKLSSRKNVQAAVDTMKRVEQYFSTLDEAIDSKVYSDSTYHLAIYASNNFSAYHYYGSTALTGNYYGSGDVTSVSQWGENEFLLNAGKNDKINSEAVRDMIYDVIFTEYMVKMYQFATVDEKIKEYSNTLGAGNTQATSLIIDEYLVGLSAQLAYETLRQVYQWEDNDDVILDKYIYYIELFDMLEIQRDTKGFIKRMQYLMDINAQQSSSSEAREFRCSKAGIAPEINECSVNTDVILLGNFRLYVR